MTDEIKRAISVLAWTIRMNEEAKKKGECFNFYFAGAGDRITIQRYKAGELFPEEKHSKYTDNNGMKKVEQFIKDLGGNEK